VVTDRAERWRLGVERGALHAVPVAAGDGELDLVVEGTHASVAALVFGAGALADLEADGHLVVTGDRESLLDLLAVLDRFSLMFPIVTP
jgi:alkyl sulfatase BDS1-like metallo-beta-lactamase superfamily hydrolase